MSANQTLAKTDVAEKKLPPLRSIYFYLTEGCNLACRHCWVSPRFQDKSKQYGFLKPDLFEHILVQAKELGLGCIKLTGGEPLLHPQVLQLLELTSKYDLRLAVETNGVLCTQEIAEALTRVKLDSISVSLDGADAATHEWMRRVPGCFEAAKQGVRRLVEKNIHPQLIMAVTKRNRDQVEEVVRLAEELQCDSVKFCFISPVGCGEQLTAKQETLTLQESIALDRWIEEVVQKQTFLPLYTSMPVAFKPLHRVFESGLSCGCNIAGLLGVLWNGSYALCGIGMSVPELIFGNAAEDALRDVWEHTPVLHELREGLPHRFSGVCGQCLTKKMCLAHCIAHNYHKTKSLWASCSICEDAYMQGLFPADRLLG